MVRFSWIPLYPLHFRLGVTSQFSGFASGEPLPDKCYIAYATQWLVLKGTCLGLRSKSQLANEFVDVTFLNPPSHMNVILCNFMR